MKKILLLLTLFFLSKSFLFAQGSSEFSEIRGFGSNPGSLKLFIHEPVRKVNAAMPLVLVLHGCSQTAKGMAEMSGWNKLADLNEFLVVYPQERITNNPNLCFDWFNKSDIEKGKGECESIYEMIRFVQHHYPVDSSRIFITGISAGAAMSVVMISVHPELFKAAAVFAGGPYKIAQGLVESVQAMSGEFHPSRETLRMNVIGQNPDFKGRYPSLYIYQGRNDAIVDPSNAKDLIRQWTAVCNADTVPDKTDSTFAGNKDIIRSEFLDNSGEKVVTFYDVDNLGHRLMVKPGEKEDEGGNNSFWAINKGFHSTYQVAKDFGILGK